MPVGDKISVQDKAQRWLLLILSLAAGCLPACDDAAGEPGPPGLEVLTPLVGGPAGERAEVLLRSRRPARVSLSSEGRLLGVGLSGPSVSGVRFDVPPWSTGGSRTEITVEAISEDGIGETAGVTLLGLGAIERTEVPASSSPAAIAAVGAAAVLLAGDRVWLVRRGGGVSHHVMAPGGAKALASDEPHGAVLVAGAGHEITTYEVDSEELYPAEVFALPDYDNNPTPPSVSGINGLHANGDLVAAATERGMSIVDRGSELEGRVYCRSRSSMTSMLRPGSFDGVMNAAVVTGRERLYAGGDYLDINESPPGADDGTCREPMAERGTGPLAPPEGSSEPWGVTAMTLSGEWLWIARGDRGIVRTLADFERSPGFDLPEEQTWRITGDELPLPVVADLAPGRMGQVWAVLQDRDGVIGGLALISDSGVGVWIGLAPLGGYPEAVDTSSGQSLVWAATSNGCALFDFRM